MWKRLRRRSFAPGRPAVYDDQVGLVVFVVVALGAGVYFALKLAI